MSLRGDKVLDTLGHRRTLNNVRIQQEQMQRWTRLNDICVERWIAAGFSDTEKKFRRIEVCKHMQWNRSADQHSTMEVPDNHNILPGRSRTRLRHHSERGMSPQLVPCIGRGRQSSSGHSQAIRIQITAAFENAARVHDHPHASKIVFEVVVPGGPAAIPQDLADVVRFIDVVRVNRSKENHLNDQ